MSECSRNIAQRGFVGCTALVAVLVTSAGVNAQCDPTVLGSFDASSGEVRAAGTMAYFDSCCPPIFVMMDCSDPATPTVAGLIERPVGHGFQVLGSTAYLGISSGMGNPAALEIYSVSDPANPVLIGDVHLPNGIPQAVAISNSVAYVLVKYGPNGAFARLHAVDISDPTGPTVESTVDEFSHLADDIDAEGNIVYVADIDLEILDFSDPANPIVLTSYNGPHYDDGLLDVHEGIAYLTPGSELSLLDVSDPSNPTYLNSIELPHHAIDVEVKGDRAYVAADDTGLQVVDVSDPADLAILGSVAPFPFSDAFFLAVSDGKVYLSDHDFIVIDIETCLAPTCAGDVNGHDQTVNVFDLLTVLENFGTNGPGAAVAPPLDSVDMFDLLGVLDAWGDCPQ